MTTEELVLRRDHGHIAELSLNRPEKLNAVSTDTLRRLKERFEEINQSPDIWCVILTGEGRAFCAGADQSERKGMTFDDIRERRRLAPAAFGAARQCRRPVIAEVRGYALGGGVEVALGCDMIIAAEDAIFGVLETLMGSMPGGGASQILPRLVGLQRAKELILTGRKFTGKQAAEWGLVNYAVPEAQLRDKVMELANEILRGAPISNEQIKKAVDASAEVGLTTGIQMEMALYERTLTAEDRAEALAAHQAKRPPNFVGR